jgi:hypothetical protein
MKFVKEPPLLNFIKTGSWAFELWHGVKYPFCLIISKTVRLIFVVDSLFMI